MSTKLYNRFKLIHTVINYKTYLMFLAVSLGISIVLQLLLPFPYGLIAAIGVIIAFPFLIRRQYMNKMRGYGGPSGSNSGGGGRAGGFFGFGSSASSGGVRYVCLVCNNKHRGGTCPRCGSKMQRADF